MKKLKGWKIALFALAGFGPNLMMTLVTAYLNDALQGEVANPAYTVTGSCIISVALCSVLFFIAKLIDGVIDIPLAWLSDRLKTKFGKRRLTILLGFFPMTASFLLLWNLPASVTDPVWNTVLESVLLIVFYTSYTMCLVSYYGCFAHIVETPRERVRLSQYKAFFDTVQYCAAYALFPLILSAVGGGQTGGIVRTMTALSPLLATMLIPLFLIRGEGFCGMDVDERVPLHSSIRIALASKPFRGWLVTLLALHTGLQLFLTGIGTTIPQNLMGMTETWKITVMNAAAFAPVPVMLALYNAVSAKRGARTAFQTALGAFAVAMFLFAAAWSALWKNPMVSFLIGITASTVGSYAIGAFFSASYVYPAQIAAREVAEQKRDHAAMYFAVQGLVTQVAGAVGVNLVYMNVIRGEITLLGRAGGQFVLVPVIAGACLLIALALSFRMDRE